MVKSVKSAADLRQNCHTRINTGATGDAAAAAVCITASATDALLHHLILKSASLFLKAALKKEE